MWVQEIYDTLYDPNTVCVACISHGKDSLAMLRAIKHLGLPLHRIVTTDVWATQDIPAVLPEMWEWKTEADKIIKEMYGIEVEHICAMQSTSMRRLTYEDIFYRPFAKGGLVGRIYGFPMMRCSWCRSMLKTSKTEKHILGTIFSDSSMCYGRKINIVKYLGIAADEPLRIARHIKKPNIVLPLVEIGWDEDLCGLISGYQNLLSPTYETSMRDGCWFCHNQGVEQLRNLRKNHPDLWALLLKWDADSPVTFKADGHTVKDFDERFALEDQGLITPSENWKWSYLTDRPIQLKMNF